MKKFHKDLTKIIKVSKIGLSAYRLIGLSAYRLIGLSVLLCLESSHNNSQNQSINHNSGKYHPAVCQNMAGCFPYAKILKGGNNCGRN